MANITGNDLVAKFQSQEWVHYAWGGSNPIYGWDCSGACNWVIGYDFHLAIPGFIPGQYGIGSGHGPVVADWIQWIGVTRGGFPQIQPEPGDLVAWGPNAHMGMAINNTRFVSAANPQAGTIEADINGFFSYDPYVLRLLEIRIGTSISDIGAPPHPSGDDYSPHIIGTAQKLRGAAQSMSTTSRAISTLRRNARY